MKKDQLLWKVCSEHHLRLSIGELTKHFSDGEIVDMCQFVRENRTALAALQTFRMMGPEYFSRAPVHIFDAILNPGIPKELTRGLYRDNAEVRL